MAKKSKRQRQKVKHKVVELSPAQQRKRGLDLIESGHYSAGVVFLEKILAIDAEDEELRQILLNGYDKLMSQYVLSNEPMKANTILAKRLKLSRMQPNIWLSIDILVRNLKYKEAILFYAEFNGDIDNLSIKHKHMLARLILYIFSSFDGLSDTFKVTDFYKQSKYAYKLFHKILMGENIKDEQIKRIGILSPYKDLRIIFRGLQLVKSGDDPQNLLLKIKKESVFYELSRVLLAVSEPAYLSYDSLKNLSKAGIQLFRRIKGLNEREYKFLLKILSDRSFNSRSHSMLDLISSYMDVLGDSGSGLLKGQLWQSAGSYEKYRNHFGEFNEVEDIKYNALWHEISHSYCYEAREYWEELVELYATNKFEKNKASALSLHLAKSYAEDSDEMIEYYNDAIQYDNTNAKAYTLLIEEKIKSNGMSSSIIMKTITKAAKAFPENAKFKELLVLNSFEKSSYSKAIKSAQKLLIEYPANKICRDVICKSSLSVLLQSANKGKFNEIKRYVTDFSKYMSSQDKMILQSLFLVGNLLAHPLISKTEGKDFDVLNSDFGVLSFVVQGALLGYPLEMQLSVVKILKEKLDKACYSLENIGLVLPYFVNEISLKKYADITPILLMSLKYHKFPSESLLNFGFLLEDMGQKKILSGYSKYFNKKTTEGEATILYFNTIKKKKSQSRVKSIAIINQLSEMKDRLETEKLLISRIDVLIKKLLNEMPVPTRSGLPKEMEALFNLFERAF